MLLSRQWSQHCVSINIQLDRVQLMLTDCVIHQLQSITGDILCSVSCEVLLCATTHIFTRSQLRTRLTKCTFSCRVDLNTPWWMSTYALSLCLWQVGLPWELQCCKANLVSCPSTLSSFYYLLHFIQLQIDMQMQVGLTLTSRKTKYRQWEKESPCLCPLHYHLRWEQYG